MFFPPPHGRAYTPPPTVEGGFLSGGGGDGQAGSAIVHLALNPGSVTLPSEVKKIPRYPDWLENPGILVGSMKPSRTCWRPDRHDESSHSRTVTKSYPASVANAVNLNVAFPEMIHWQSASFSYTPGPSAISPWEALCSGEHPHPAQATPPALPIPKESLGHTGLHPVTQDEPSVRMG